MTTTTNTKPANLTQYQPPPQQQSLTQSSTSPSATSENGVLHSGRGGGQWVESPQAWFDHHICENCVLPEAQNRNAINPCIKNDDCVQKTIAKYLHTLTTQQPQHGTSKYPPAKPVRNESNSVLIDGVWWRDSTTNNGEKCQRAYRSDQEREGFTNTMQAYSNLYTNVFTGIAQNNEKNRAAGKKEYNTTFIDQHVYWLETKTETPNIGRKPTKQRGTS